MSTVILDIDAKSNREGAAELMHHSHSASIQWTDTCEVPSINKFPLFYYFSQITGYNNKKRNTKT
jgi:hypothetical protein